MHTLAALVQAHATPTVLPAIDHVWHLRPQDVLVFRTAQICTSEQIERLVDQVMRLTGCRLLVLQDNLTIESVLRPSDPTQDLPDPGPPAWWMSGRRR